VSLILASEGVLESPRPSTSNTQSGAGSAGRLGCRNDHFLSSIDWRSNILEQYFRLCGRSLISRLSSRHHTPSSWLAETAIAVAKKYWAGVFEGAFVAGNALGKMIISYY
jgi:hypothetical protein